MGALLTAYIVVWVGVALYVVRLGAVQHKLANRVHALQSKLDKCDRAEEPISRAA